MNKRDFSKYIANACTLYHSLQLYEEKAPAFLSARGHGIDSGFNYAQGKIKDLIAKVEEVENLKHELIFKNCIDKLTLLYKLNK